MPLAPLRTCLEARCAARQRGARCPTHQRAKERERPGFETWRKWYRTARWLRLRARILVEQPLCVDCLKAGHTEASTQVDHKVPHRGDARRFWDTDNLQGLCESCHSRKTQAGG